MYEDVYNFVHGSENQKQVPMLNNIKFVEYMLSYSLPTEIQINTDCTSEIFENKALYF